MVKLYGSLNKDLYTRYLREAFLVISASKSDAGLSSSIAEAMSCEAIVMCTNNRDNPYWIKHGSNGFLFKNNNIKDFSKKFFKICNLSKIKKNTIKKNARKIQLENNDLNIEMEKVKKIYRSIYMKISN
jgi:glycosyltransferase involved in cell wall biosynthesis